MAGLVPSSRSRRVAFYKSQVAPWTDNDAAIGLTAPDVADLSMEVQAAEAAENQMLQARSAAKAATAHYYNTVETLTIHGATMIDTIRNFARQSDDPANVYNLARIPAPRPPAPVPAPGTPTAPTASIEPTGALTLGWKCKNPANSSGTVYEIHRQVNGGVWEPVASTGRKTHTDTTIPAGASSLKYQVRAVRSTVAGIAAQFNVSLGSGAGAGVASVAPEAFERGRGRSPALKAA